MHITILLSLQSCRALYRNISVTHPITCLIQLQHQSMSFNVTLCFNSILHKVARRAKRSSGFLSEAFRCCCKAYFTVRCDRKLITGFRLLSFCLLVFWRLKAIAQCICFLSFQFLSREIQCIKTHDACIQIVTV